MKEEFLKWIVYGFIIVILIIWFSIFIPSIRGIGK